MHNTPHVILKALKLHFRDMWSINIRNSSKLEYYRYYKTEFVKESQLDLVHDYNDRASLTRIRISAHRL